MGPHSFECGIRIALAIWPTFWPSCFNGAALIRVRNSGERQQAPSPALPASMGPHSFECGIYTPPPPPGPWQIWLQWGRTHSSAEYGPAEMAGGGAGGTASMGPHSFECGINKCRTGRVVQSEAASMGPHSFECGIKTARDLAMRAADEGFNGAALIRVRNSARGVPRACRFGGFNGAALIRVRNMLAEYRQSVGSAPRFNGAALIRVRNRDTGSRRSAGYARRFNGAALIRVRNIMGLSAPCST